MKWIKELTETPPEGKDLLVFDHHGGYGPWIARYNKCLNRFSVAQPSEIEWLGPNASWCLIELPETERKNDLGI